MDERNPFDLSKTPSPLLVLGSAVFGVGARLLTDETIKHSSGGKTSGWKFFFGTAAVSTGYLLPIGWNLRTSKIKVSVSTDAPDAKENIPPSPSNPLNFIPPWWCLIPTTMTFAFTSIFSDTRESTKKEASYINLIPAGSAVGAGLLNLLLMGIKKAISANKLEAKAAMQVAEHKHDDEAQARAEESKQRDRELAREKLRTEEESKRREREIEEKKLEVKRQELEIEAKKVAVAEREVAVAEANIVVKKEEITLEKQKVQLQIQYFSSAMFFPPGPPALMPPAEHHRAALEHHEEDGGGNNNRSLNLDRQSPST